MVEEERENVLSGLDYFYKSFDGENPLSPCGIPYLFLTLYQNKVSDLERASIIQDIKIHIGQVDIVHLHGFCNIDTPVTLKQNINIKLCKLLLALCTNQSSTRPFVQVENGADPDYIVCIFNSVDREIVMANLPFLSTYIKQCIMEEELKHIFYYEIFSITTPGRSIPIKVGNIQVKAKPIPQDIHEDTTQMPPSPSFSSVTSATTVTPQSFSSSLGDPAITIPCHINGNHWVMVTRREILGQVIFLYANDLNNTTTENRVKNTLSSANQIFYPPTAIWMKCYNYTFSPHSNECGIRSLLAASIQAVHPAPHENILLPYMHYNLAQIENVDRFLTYEQSY